MPKSIVNGVELYWEMSGDSGEPLVFIHGSWADHNMWEFVAPPLAESFRVLTYDRRGHSQSERPNSQGSFEEDADDAAALIEHLDLAPAHIVGLSAGGNIALRLAVKRPDLVRSLIIHEPGLFAIVDDPETAVHARRVEKLTRAAVEIMRMGDHEEGVRQIMDNVVWYPGAWEETPEEIQQRLLYNVPTFVDEIDDPDVWTIDLQSLANCPPATLFTYGQDSQPFFSSVVQKLAGAVPHARVVELEGAGHVPTATHPEDYVAMLRTYIYEVMS